MKVTRVAAFSQSAFADAQDLNPWLLLMRQMDQVSVQANNVGFVTNQIRHANRHLTRVRSIGESFLLNTRMHNRRREWTASGREYFSSQLAPVIARSGSESIDSVRRVRLPDPVHLPLPFGSVLDRRKSIRAFSADSMELGDLSTILYAAGGISHHEEGVAVDRPARYPLHFRNVPSSGGLYSVECYLFALNVHRLQVGVYKYLPYEHSIAQVADIQDSSPKQKQAMQDCFMNTGQWGVNLESVALAMIYVGNPQKLMRKYGDRGVRYLLIECGMVAMTANFAATALGWGTLDYQSFYEPEAERVVGLRNRQRHVLHTQLFGWPLTSKS